MSDMRLVAVQRTAEFWRNVSHVLACTLAMLTMSYLKSNIDRDHSIMRTFELCKLDIAISACF